MEQYFRGNRELFKGLAIDRLEPEEWERHAIYIIEFKFDKSPEAALRQIEEKHYDLPYRHLGKPS